MTLMWCPLPSNRDKWRFSLGSPVATTKMSKKNTGAWLLLGRGHTTQALTWPQSKDVTDSWHGKVADISCQRSKYNKLTDNKKQKAHIYIYSVSYHQFNCISSTTCMLHATSVVNHTSILSKKNQYIYTYHHRKYKKTVVSNSISITWIFGCSEQKRLQRNYQQKSRVLQNDTRIKSWVNSLELLYLLLLFYIGEKNLLNLHLPPKPTTTTTTTKPFATGGPSVSAPKSPPLE